MLVLIGFYLSPPQSRRKLLIVEKYSSFRLLQMNRADPFLRPQIITILKKSTADYRTEFEEKKYVLNSVFIIFIHV